MANYSIVMVVINVITQSNGEHTHLDSCEGETDAAAGLAPISQRKHVSDER